MRLLSADLCGLAAAIVLVAVTGPAIQPALARQATPCGCPDVSDMLNRLAMAQTAIDVIGEQKKLMPSSAMYNQTNYATFKQTVTGAMAAVQMLGANVSWGHTDEDCVSSVTTHSTACIDSIVKLHEDDVHVPACNAAPKLPLVGGQAASTMLAYADEEIRGYQREISRIRELLRLMPASCRPGWIGFVNFYENRTVETNATLPPTQMRISGSERSFVELIRKAKILHRENQPSFINMWIDERSAKTTETKVKIGCTGGLAYRPPDRVLSSTTEHRGTAAAAFEGESRVAFGYDPASGSWFLSFDLPETKGQGSASITSHQSGNCNPDDDGNKPIGGSTWDAPYASDTIAAQGVTGKNLDVIQVEHRLDTGPQLSSPNASFKHSGRITITMYAK